MSRISLSYFLDEVVVPSLIYLYVIGVVIKECNQDDSLFLPPNLYEIDDIFMTWRPQVFPKIVFSVALFIHASTIFFLLYTLYWRRRLSNQPAHTPCIKWVC